MRWIGLAQDRKPARNPLNKLASHLGFFPQDEYLEGPQLARALFGGLPDEVPDVAALVSPITHVRPHCPPTLFLQGTHDHITPLEDVRALHRALVAVDVPVVYVELPYIEHAFDLVVPRVSPPARAALYDLERFLALVA